MQPRDFNATELVKETFPPVPNKAKVKQKDKDTLILSCAVTVSELVKQDPPLMFVLCTFVYTNLVYIPELLPNKQVQ